MSDLFSAFVVGLGAFLILTAAVATWILRHSTVHLAFKMIVPLMLVTLGVLTPWGVSSLMGFPVITDFASLPPKVELVSFIARDDDKIVDLWLRVGAAAPRAYEIPLTDGLKKTLREAQQQQQKGNRVGLSKRGKQAPVGQQYMDIDGGKAPYELDPSAFQLPPKGAQ
jgi:hypothetical protein